MQRRYRSEQTLLARIHCGNIMLFGDEVPPSGMPPGRHPGWHGSVSAKWSDKFGAHGKPRCLRQVNTNARDGVDGISRQGLGGFFTDNEGRMREARAEGLRCFSTSSLPSRGSAEWRPCRVIVQPPPVTEPTALSKHPPFVPRRGHSTSLREAQCYPMTEDPGSTRRMQSFLQHRRDKRYRQDSIAENSEREMVRNLEEWEREHLPRAVAGGGAHRSAMYRSFALSTRKRDSMLHMSSAGSFTVQQRT